MPAITYVALSHKHAPNFLLRQAHCVLVVDLPFHQNIHNNFANALVSNIGQQQIKAGFDPSYNLGHSCGGCNIYQVNKHITRDFVNGWEHNSSQQA